ncbi:MAG: bifunctional phosphopantothenoylcysteine decarboxylase/phosphopantothenate synthase [Terrabacter sp.]|nr:bifunctional phosphopantothenoylcysteine decarboxylase/phosphopantothenate synthase [Terrabacter sp.]
MRVVLGVSGGIAAYKACSLLRLFTEHGHDVTVVPTAAALQFVGAPTWSALSGKPVSTEVWTSVHEVPHVRIGQSADLVVVATQANVATLRSRGAHVIEPAVGRLTGKDSGAGRLPEPEALYAACLAILAGDRAAPAGSAQPAPGVPRDLEGRRVVVSAGGTREPLDPVRYLGNRSSGKQGVAIARAAADRGAKVTLVAANVSLPVPEGIDVVRVETTLQLQRAVEEAASDADVVVMAAAPADFRPALVSESKIKKSSDPDAGLRVELVENPDIVRGLVADRDARGAGTPFIVSFAAETGDANGSVMDHARAKFVRKGSDLQVVNEVGADLTFGKDDTTVHLLRRGSDAATTVGPTSKDAVADALWDTISPLLD